MSTNPQIISGQAIGSTVSVRTTADLAALSIQGMTLGSSVFVVELSKSFVLTLSSAATVPDQIIAVNGIDGYRWILQAGAQTIGLNGANIYVSPLGDDTNNGTTWQSAVKTGYHGYSLLVPAGGGTLHVANGTEWGGPVPGQGCWLRGDGLNVPGWQQLVPCIIEGSGPGTVTSNFQNPGTAILYAGSNLPADYRTKPATWTAGSNFPVEFVNIQTSPVPGFTDSEVGNYYAFRSGWDYPRLVDGSRNEQVISSSTRTSTGSGATANGSTVHTVALAPALVISSAERVTVAGVTTLTVTVLRTTAVPTPPYGIGTKVYLDFTGFPQFTSGVYSVGTIINAGAGAVGFNWAFTTTDTGADTGVVANPGTLRSIVCTEGDLIDLESNDGQFPSTQYLVTATSITGPSTGTVTVFDPYGGYGGINNNQGPTANIGVLIQQERGWNATLSAKFTNCSSRSAHAAVAHQVFRFGPMFDQGGSVAFGPTLDQCYLEGFYPGNDLTLPYDPYRMSACLDRCAQNVPGASSGITATGCRGSMASFRITLTGSSVARINDFLSDGVFAPPAYVIDGNNASIVYLDYIQTADAADGYGFALNSISSIPGVNINGNSANGYPLSLNGGIGGAAGPSSNGIVVPAQVTQWQRGESPWINLTVGSWGYKDMLITGKHPSAWRQASPTSARFQNMIGSPSTWTGAGTPVTTGITDPLGGTGAVRITDLVNTFPLATDTVNTWTQDGYFVLAGWVNTTPDGADPAYLFAFTGAGNAVFRSSGNGTFLKNVPFVGGGWQFVCHYDKVTNNCLASQAYAISVSKPLSGHIDLFGLAGFYIPSTVSENDVAEFVGTLRAQPYYLLPGMAGTFEGQKLIGHGGLGTAKHYTVGVASGNITLGGANNKAIELFDESGTSLGVVPLQSFTVNP